MKKHIKLLAWGVLMLSAAGAEAVDCTTNPGTGTWGTVATWSCGHVPVSTDTVVITRNITLSANSTIAGLTVDAGVTFSGNNRNLTVNGPVSISGIYNTGGGDLTTAGGGALTVNVGGTLNFNGGNAAINGNVTIDGTLTSGGNALQMTGADTTVSGTGTINNTDFEIEAMRISLPTGSTLEFTNGAQLRVGNNNSASFTLDGTITGFGMAAGDRIVRVYQNSSMTINGTINAPNTYIRMEQNASITNNGNVSVQYLRTDAVTSTWTQGANSNLTLLVTAPAGDWNGVLNASANGNTVTYNGTATVIAPSAGGYWNLAGTIFPGVCPHGFTVSGTNPCSVGGPVSVTLSPGLCVDDATVGTPVWGAGLTNVGSSNNLYATSATAALIGTQLTHYLKCTNYGFAIPLGATINGITVGVERKISSTRRTTAKDSAVRVVKAGVIGASDRSKATLYTTTDNVPPEPHGGAADLWAQTWTPAEINAANFGAAFSASVTTTRANARTVSVDHMPITVTYTSAATVPHHIQIEHSGAGKTCAPEILTVKACADAACTTNFTTAAVTGNVTWGGAPNVTLPFNIASGGTGQVSVNLSVTTPQTATLGVSAVSPVPTAASGCTNLAGGTACSLNFVAATTCFDAVEVGAVAITPIFTKLSGTSFDLDVRTVNNSNYPATGTGTVAVELVDASTGTCATHPQLNTQNVTFSVQNKRTVTFNYANAARTVKVRMTPGALAPSCSSDAFVIRPVGFTVTSVAANADALGISTTATPILAAGSAFTLTATAVAGYNGTPTVDVAMITPHSGAIATGAFAGTFGTAAIATGVATGSNFSYGEVGYFRFDANAITDMTFANLDAQEATPECTLDYSNTLVGGKYGCYFGNQAATAYFGRFVPHHFEVLQGDIENRADLCQGGVLVSDGGISCAPSFTYMGERFDTNFTLTAATLAGTTTKNYTGGFAKLDPLASNSTLLWGAMDAGGANLTSRLDTSLVTASGSGSFGNGEAVMSVPLAVTRGVAADGAFTAVDFGIAPVDSDGVTTVFDLDVNNDAVMDHTQINLASTELRYGRLHLTNAFGSDLLPLGMLAKVEYWNGTAYTGSSDDDLSVLAFNLGNHTAGLNAGETALSAVPLMVNGVVRLTLSAPGVGNSGSVDVSGSLPSYLPSDTGRATFGVFKGKNEFIYLRESY